MENNIIDCVKIVDNITNGDVIRSIFPKAKIERGLYGLDGTPLVCLKLGTRHDAHEMAFVEDWWNAPFKMDKEEDER